MEESTQTRAKKQGSRLTGKRKKFIRYMQTEDNATAAARKAGYKDAKRSAYHLLHDPEINARVKKLEEKTDDAFAQKLGERRALTRDWFENQLVTLVESAPDMFGKRDHQARGLQLAAKVLKLIDQPNQPVGTTVNAAGQVTIVVDPKLDISAPMLKFHPELKQISDGNPQSVPGMGTEERRAGASVSVRS